MAFPQWPSLPPELQEHIASFLDDVTLHMLHATTRAGYAQCHPWFARLTHCTDHDNVAHIMATFFLEPAAPAIYVERLFAYMRPHWAVDTLTLSGVIFSSSVGATLVYFAARAGLSERKILDVIYQRIFDNSGQAHVIVPALARPSLVCGYAAGGHGTALVDAWIITLDDWVGYVYHDVPEFYALMRKILARHEYQSPWARRLVAKAAWLCVGLPVAYRAFLTKLA